MNKKAPITDFSSTPAMSVKEARKRLGKKYSSLSDDQVAHIVALLDRIASETIRDFSSK